MINIFLIGLFFISLMNTFFYGSSTHDPYIESFASYPNQRTFGYNCKSSNTINYSIILPVGKDFHILENKLLDISNPESPNWRQYMSIEEIQEFSKIFSKHKSFEEFSKIFKSFRSSRAQISTIF